MKVWYLIFIISYVIQNCSLFIILKKNYNCRYIKSRLNTMYCGLQSYPFGSRAGQCNLDLKIKIHIIIYEKLFQVNTFRYYVIKLLEKS